MNDASDRPTAGRIVALLVYYGLATLVGGVIFALLMRLATLLGPGVLFYRGLVALAVTALALLVVSALLLPKLARALLLRADDSIGGAIVAACLLSSVFVLGPVTVDRSISVFMLSQFESAGKPLTVEEIRDRFVRTYVVDWAQMDRRVKEQQLSGNLEPADGGGWKLTPQGRRFMEVARWMSWLVDADPRFVGRAK
ncbi:MAG TPA: hypothetical protein PKA55_08025 [Rhodoblastus sp.]|nr:hypothetical protein [Rhodoblastus sp.]